MRFRIRFNDGTIFDTRELQSPTTEVDNYANFLNSLLIYKNHDNAFIQIGDEQKKYTDLYSVEIILETNPEKGALI